MGQITDQLKSTIANLNLFSNNKLMLLLLWSRLSYFISDFSWYLVFNIIFFGFFLFFIYKIFKSKAAQTKKKLLLSLACFFIISIFTFSGFEAYFRYVYDKSDGLGFLRVNSKWHKRHVVHNSYFYRDRDFSIEKQKNVKRIGVMGDSITFGGGIENVNDRFSNLLEKKLRENGYTVEVYNLGKPGYDTDGEIAEYQNVKNLNFDIIIWQYFLNDIQPQGKSTGTPIISQESKKGEIITFFSNKSFFFDFLYWRFSAKYDKTFKLLENADLTQYKKEQILRFHKQIISNFVNELNNEGKKGLVIIFPFVHLIGPEYPASEIHQDISSYFKDQGVTVIDLLELLKDKKAEDLIASKFDSHPNEEVHKLASEELYKKIIDYLN